MDAGYLRNQFLIAMPSLSDENFGHTVTLLCEHNEQGALGLVINRPTELHLNEMLSHLSLDPGAISQANPPVYWGGPVQPERGFVVHREAGDWESTMHIGDHLWVTTSRDILGALTEGRGPDHYIVLLGYAGWGAGQLETELLSNAWLNTPVDKAILFDTPVAARWSAATRLLGVDVTQLTGDAGHA